MGAINTLFPILNDAAAAASNTTRIQALLDAGGECELVGSGIAWVGRLQIGSFTSLKVDRRLTLKQGAGLNSNLIVTKSLLRAWSNVTLTWTSGATVSVAMTGHGLSVGDVLAVKGTAGTTDAAFSGPFRVKAVTDANNVVVSLRRTPAASPTGTIQAKKCETNFSIEGGLWDYNRTQNPGSADDYTLFMAVIGQAADFRLKDMRAIDTSKYCFCVGGVRDYAIDGLTVFSTNSDGLKVYGPAFDGTVRNCSGISSDDFVSVQAEEPAAYQQYNFTGWGDVLGLDIDNVSCDGNSAAQGFACSVYAPPDDYLMDNITLRRITSRQTNGVAINVDGQGTSSRRIRSLNIENCEHRESAKGGISINTVTVDLLRINGYKVRHNGASLVSIGLNNTTIRKLIVDGCDWYNAATGCSFMQTNGTVTIEHGTFENNDIQGFSTSDGTFVGINSASGTIGLLEFLNNNIQGIQKPFELSAAAHASNPTVVFKGNRTGSRVLAGMKAQMRLVVGDNIINNADMAIARLEKASTAFELESLGGNKLTGSSVWQTKIVGSETLTAKGWDIEVDVSALSRADKQYCYNTNAALGTLAAAGHVVCQGNASGSWHLLADPTKVY